MAKATMANKSWYVAVIDSVLLFSEAYFFTFLCPKKEIKPGPISLSFLNKSCGFLKNKTQQNISDIIT